MELPRKKTSILTTTSKEQMQLGRKSVQAKTTINTTFLSFSATTGVFYHLSMCKITRLYPNLIPRE
jgi:hypothetical protein